MRESAGNWLEVADKVWHFRRDVLSTKEAIELRQRTDSLRQQLKAKAEGAKLKLGIESLEEVLRRTGGAMYPKSALVENIEFLLVAAIVIIGVRTFLVQPFKIPTNSMWPTYNGMTSEVYHAPAEEPNAVAVAARAVTFGAWPHRVDAPDDGEVLIPVNGITGGRGLVDYRVVPGKTWLIFPTELREYALLVGDKPVFIRVPLDFDFDWVLDKAFFGNSSATNPHGFANNLERKYRARDYVTRTVNGQPTNWFRTGKIVKAGERVLSFDELTGDQLFVDRVTYNFMRPKVGQGFVFGTGKIPGIGIDQYYVKRLVGTPGDTIQVHEPAIYRNGQPITGSTAFELNARREPPYRGYFNAPMNSEARYLLRDSDQVVIGPNKYFAMGDNSGFSSDSRYWGFVPAKEVIGRPLFIYFPLTKHWGPTR
ncbi:MAG: signal peptidase [Verrucomicrobia bacterium]|nr:signal peptidase [Verrucomicrobiota bacterium]